MVNWEDNLPPIVRQRLATIGELTREEKENMMASERVDSLLSKFHEGRIDTEGLWKRLKEERKPSILKQAQMKLVDSLSLGSTPAETKRKRDGILPIETLKKEQNPSVLELDLDLVEDLQERYRAEAEQTYNSLRAEVEKDPRLRIRQAPQGQNTMMIQLTPDEATKELPEWRDFLSHHEKRYNEDFAKVVGGLRERLE
ncbi:MAG: hypothetical protein V3T04_03100 [Dehalococcoidia bacterium]